MGLFNKKPKTAVEKRKKPSRADITWQASERSLADFKTAGVKEYTIRACGDGRVCDACKKQNNMKYKTRDAVIGKTAPPFCEECRCVMLPIM
ncbi:hypothetical protein FACS1894208_05510 [Clostridia bacterium]|nr:hypothetical protein FACS1894208_05510 [Clostridia bacterium]